MTSEQRGSVLPILAVLAGAAIGATSGLYIKGLAFSGLAMTSFRMTVPFLLTLPHAAKRGVLLGKGELRGRLILASCLNAGRLYLFILAYRLTSIGNAVVLLYLWPVFSLLFESARARRRLEPAKLGSLALATGGVLVMNLNRGFSFSGTDFWGSLCMIASSLVFAGVNLIFKESLMVFGEIDTLYFQNAVGGLVYLPFLAIALPRASAGDLGLGLLYGVIVGLLGFGLFFVGMKRLPLFRYSALTYAEVPFGLALGAIFRGERLSVNHGVGALLVLAGSALAQRLKGRPREVGA